jgi:hypothetical protein
MAAKKHQPTRPYRWASWAAGAALSALPWEASATHKVYSPRVEAGVVSLEVRGHAGFDDDHDADGLQSHRLELEYGINEVWKTAFFGTFEGDADQAVRYTTTGWENIFYLLREDRHGLGAGLYLEYEKAHRAGAADEIELKVLLERGFLGFVNTVNLNFDKGVWEDAHEGVEFAYAWRTTHTASPHFGLGFEAFGEIGELHDAPPVREQEHQIGPLLYGELDLESLGELESDLGVLFGLTEGSPDFVLKWQLEIALPF